MITSKKLEVARRTLRNASVRLGAVANTRRPDPKRLTEASEAVEIAARAFVDTERELIEGTIDRTDTEVVEAPHG